ncbi:hypothetical protein PWEIH_16378 [Listeria weihenstephanensis FSL R9-0317]|uniref:Membrane protein n=1 Tax=Listeria weihenstephanensis TaxID=1006155 RepID=A0A1S7FW29_9LIST|nr:glycosyltransferase family 39 protein [Listeria weihenstephanensis]AQY51641.1 membrane protein [Listeria weihenstephanensis]EUJ34831.1 hypothetical protein PWEIH_16378 [Listeria weihenstephanensis FSL R9-0317]
MKNRLAYIFYGFFILIFGYLLVMSTLKPFDISFNNAGTLILLTAVALLILVGIFQFTGKLNRKGDTFITISLVLAIIMSQVYVISSLHMDAFADGYVIKGEALKMLANGGHATGQNYFMMYPNNIFITIVRYWLYHIGDIIGITNTYILENIFIFVCMNITIFTLFWIVLKELGRKFANIFLLIILFCVPLLGYVLYFYTDTIVLPFTALILLFYYLYTKNNKWWYFIFIGFLFVVGYHVKPNIIILLPAMFIHLCFISNWRKIILNMAILVVCFLSLNTVFTPLAERYGFEKNDAVEFPQTHWVMMGLGEPAGRYNRDDVAYTMQFKSKAEKQEANINVIKERLITYGPIRTLKLYNNKELNTWTDGTRAYSWYINSAINYPTTYDYLFGDKRVFAEVASQIFHTVNLLLICLSALRFYRKREYDISFFINISLIGVWLFHILWEANQRYILFITPLMIVSSLFGFKLLIELFYTDKLILKNKIRKPFLILSFVVFLLCTSLLAFGGKVIAGEPVIINNYIVDQSYATIALPVDHKNSIKQTFKTGDKFNSIGIYVMRMPSNDSMYRFQVKDEGSKSIIYDEIKSGASLQSNTDFQLQVNEVPQASTSYSIEVSEISNSNQAEPLVLGTNIKNDVDLYPYGNLYINNVKQENADLGFKVAQQSEKPLIPWYSYLILSFLAVGLFIGIYFVFKRKK